MRHKVRNLCTARYVVSLVELEGLFKHFLTEPDSCKSVQKSFIEVICHPTTILYFTQHVMNCDPRYALERGEQVIANDLRTERLRN